MNKWHRLGFLLFIFGVGGATHPDLFPAVLFQAMVIVGTWLVMWEPSKNEESE